MRHLTPARQARPTGDVISLEDAPQGIAQQRAVATKRSARRLRLNAVALFVASLLGCTTSPKPSPDAGTCECTPVHCDDAGTPPPNCDGGVALTCDGGQPLACDAGVAPEDVELQVTPSGTPYSLRSALARAGQLTTTSRHVVVRLANGTYDMTQHSNADCGGVPCITFVGIPNPERIDIIGNTAQPADVVLRFRQPADAGAYWPGGFYLYEAKSYGRLDGFTLRADYDGWVDRAAHTPKQVAFPAPSDIRFTTMALWARGGARVTLGPQVLVEGFYFGVASEGLGTWVDASGVRVTGCGDAAFIAWAGATLTANDSEASWCAAWGWGLGSGYVAETVHPARIANYADSDPLTRDDLIRTYAYDYATGVRAGVDRPLLDFVDSELAALGRRTLVTADRARAHDNLFVGFLGNVGGELRAASAIAYRNGLSSVASPGPIWRGGFVAQLGSVLHADSAVSFHNAGSGFASLLRSTLTARHATAFGNTAQGFQALEEDSVTIAQGARAFSFGAPQPTGYLAEREAVVVVSQSARAGSQAAAFDFDDPLSARRIRVTPQPNTVSDYSPPRRQSGNDGGVMR